MIKSMNLLSLIDLDKAYQQCTNPVCVNDIPHDVDSYSDYLEKQLFFSLDGQLDFSASCSCGELVGNYYESMICNKCGSAVSSEFVNSLEHKNWIDIPMTMAPVLHPVFYLVLNNLLGRMTNYPVLGLILNPGRRLPKEIGGKGKIEGQGSKYFYENHPKILNFLFTKHRRTANKLKDNPEILTFIELHYKKMFTRKLPIMDPVMHPEARVGDKMYSTDPVIKNLLDSINTLAYSTKELKRSITEPRYADRSQWRAYESFIKYVEDIITIKLGGKPGHLRKQVFGFRGHFTCRAVVVPHTKADMADEVAMPWKPTLHNLKLHIINHLTRRHGYTIAEAEKKFMRAVVKFDDDIYQIVNTIIAEFKWPKIKESAYFNNLHGIPLFVGRNPTLEHGSIYLMRGTSIKTDVNDGTIAFPAMVAPIPNLDYDGDQVYVSFIFEEATILNAFKTMHPKEMLTDKNKMIIGSGHRLTVPSMLCLNGYLDEEEIHLKETGFDFSAIKEAAV